MMFSVQRLINKPFEIYSKEVSESLKILSPKKEFLAKNIGNYNPTDYILFSYILHVLCTIVPMGNGPQRFLSMGWNPMFALIKTIFLMLHYNGSEFNG